ncbi:MAG: D-2-hydroxyacid dehydrogenase family protein [Actinobacteria bacterium]|nr:D-2-hydroxyacid dehydrogenase family protein [Actinomycetota bacterium]
MTPRVAVLDDYQDAARRFGPWNELAGRVELDVIHEHIPDPDQLASRLADAEIVMAMRERTPFPRDLLERLPGLRLIVSTGRGNAAIDVAAAIDLGIVVSGTDIPTSPTAELTWALILSVTRKVCAEDANLRAGGWQHTIGPELSGRTLGVIGLGRQGSRVASFGKAFDMNVISWSQNLNPDDARSRGVEPVSKDELLAAADVVTLHLRLSDRTRGIISAADLAKMKPTAYLINTSRGPLVDEAALVQALLAGAIAGAGIDVYEIEPLPADHPLRSAPNTVLTPHIGYVSEGTYEVFFTQAVEDIAAYLDGAPIRVYQA